jgi:hypothetical protein
VTGEIFFHKRSRNPTVLEVSSAKMNKALVSVPFKGDPEVFEYLPVATGDTALSPVPRNVPRFREVSVSYERKRRTVLPSVSLFCAASMILMTSVASSGLTAISPERAMQSYRLL